MSGERWPGEEELRRFSEKFQRHLGDGFVRLGELLREGGERPAESQAAGDPASRLRTLRQMETEGLITHDEYEAKKAEILARL